MVLDTMEEAFKNESYIDIFDTLKKFYFTDEMDRRLDGWDGMSQREYKYPSI